MRVSVDLVQGGTKTTLLDLLALYIYINIKMKLRLGKNIRE